MLRSLKPPEVLEHLLDPAEGFRSGASRSKPRPQLLAVSLALVSACGTGDGPRQPAEYEYLPPVSTGDGRETASLSEVQIDEARVERAVERIRNQVYRQVHALLIVRNGRLALEEYFSGNNRAGAYVRYDRDTVHDLASATKSVTSILTGLSIQNGFIRSPREPALAYLPEYGHLGSPRKDRITMEHLLTMTSGWEWSESTAMEPGNDMFLFNSVRDPLGFLIAKDMVADPGEVWCYNGGAVTLPGKIIERASGLDLESFSDRYLFAPMGITDFAWPYIKPDLIAAHGDLDLRPRDMAKIGQMMLSGGVWDRRQILASDWVDAS
jgi:CubicO group peptidase (beta-lactamase class C family)